MIGIWSLRFSWGTMAIFPKTETSAQASCGQRHVDVRWEERGADLKPFQVTLPTETPTWINVIFKPDELASPSFSIVSLTEISAHFDKLFLVRACKANHEQADHRSNHIHLISCMQHTCAHPRDGGSTPWEVQPKNLGEDCGPQEPEPHPTPPLENTIKSATVQHGVSTASTDEANTTRKHLSKLQQLQGTLLKALR